MFKRGLRRSRETLDLDVESMLCPFLEARIRIPERPSSVVTNAELSTRTDEFNAASEAYFAEYETPDFLLGKPFADPDNYALYLFNLGVLFHGLRLGPGDVVLELGAGSCWVSHFLNLLGCPTISIDISSTALQLGEQYFRNSRRTRWELEPRFLHYDGRRFPLEDDSCDRIVLHEAFHHIPNQEEILREMSRVLRPGSIVAMAEPGREHTKTEAAQREMETGVLENDILLEELAELAERCGFSKVTFLPISLHGLREVEAKYFSDFLHGREFEEHWVPYALGLIDSHFILLYNGEFGPDSRRADGLAGRVELVGDDAGKTLFVQANEPTSLRFRVSNIGRARWLTTGLRRGKTRLGGHLYRDRKDASLEWDWLRVDLGSDVEPGDQRELLVELPRLGEAGKYRVEIDLVAEDVAWFAEIGSSPLSINIEVVN